MLASAILIFLGISFFEKTLFTKIKDLKPTSVALDLQQTETNTPKGKLINKFAVLSDTHSDNENTKKAVDEAKALGISQLLVTGDLTTVGTVTELTAQKKIYDSSGVSYAAVLGDHDLWQSGQSNFREVFGSPYQSFDKDGVHFIMMDSSDVDKGLGRDQLDWLKTDLSVNQGKITFIFMHLPPYHPYNSRTIWEKAGSNSAVKQQVDQFFEIIKGKVAGIFCGDHHFSSSYTEPSSHVKINVVGAVTRSRNLQEPRFDFVEVYSSGDFKVNEELIK